MSSLDRAEAIEGQNGVQLDITVDEGTFSTDDSGSDSEEVSLDFSIDEVDEKFVLISATRGCQDHRSCVSRNARKAHLAKIQQPTVCPNCFFTCKPISGFCHIRCQFCATEWCLNSRSELKKCDQANCSGLTTTNDLKIGSLFLSGNSTTSTKSTQQKRTDLDDSTTASSCCSLLGMAISLLLWPLLMIYLPAEFGKQTILGFYRRRFECHTPPLTLLILATTLGYALYPLWIYSAFVFTLLELCAFSGIILSKCWKTIIWILPILVLFRVLYVSKEEGHGTRSIKISRFFIAILAFPFIPIFSFYALFFMIQSAVAMSLDPITKDYTKRGSILSAHNFLS